MRFNNLKQEQDKLLKMLKSFDAFCRRHNIKYFLFAGTELGAVREKGFIAWDGDIDLMMSFAEYKRLLDAYKNSAVQDFRLVTYEDDKNIPTLFARIYEVGVDASHLEDFSYIEIFPFTGLPKSKFLSELLWFINFKNSQIFWVKNRIYTNNLRRRHNQIGLILKLMLFWWPNRLSIWIFKKSTESKRLANAKTLTSLLCLYSCKRISIPASWLEDEPVYMKFEDAEFPVLKEYDQQLKNLYGNYMVPKRYARYK